MLTILIQLLLVSTLVYSASIHQCSENEEFVSCASPCQPNCQNNITAAKPCPAICITGCVCREGFIREREGGGCVRSCEGVSNRCRENEEFTTCASACPRKCGDEGIKPCPLICIQGCRCKEGYLRDRSGQKCIREEEC